MVSDQKVRTFINHVTNCFDHVTNCLFVCLFVCLLFNTVVERRFYRNAIAAPRYNKFCHRLACGKAKWWISLRTGAVCKNKNFGRCPGCFVFYCSKECWVKDYSNHVKKCVNIKDLL